MRTDRRSISIDLVLSAISSALGERPTNRPTVEEIANQLELTASQLRRRLRKAGHPPVRELVARARILWAAQLIAEGTKIEAALRLVGFSHHGSFNRRFRLYLSMNPSEYRRRLNDPSATD